MKVYTWIAVLAVCMGILPSYAGKVTIIDYTTVGNGGFESGTTNLYDGTDSWSNNDTVKGDLVAARVSSNDYPLAYYDGGQNGDPGGEWAGLVRRDTDFRYHQPIQDTGYTIQGGDMFRFRCVARAAATPLASAETQSIRVRLAYGSIESQTLLESRDFVVPTNKFNTLEWTFGGEGIATNDAAVGENLLVYLLPVGGKDVELYVDNIQLEAIQFTGEELVSPTLLNGGFESAATSTSTLFSAIDYWSNADTNIGDNVEGRQSTNDASNRAYSGEWGGRMSRYGPNYRQPLLSTGYTIQEGDIFSLGAAVAGAWGWGADPTFEVRLNLHAYDDQGERHGIGSIDASSDGWSWNYAAAEFDAITNGSPIIGKELLFRALPLGNNLQAFVDDVRVTVYNAGDADNDTDGMPDGWEEDFFGHVTNGVAAADNDLDGVDNLSEYIAGTNPTNSASFFAVAPLSTPSVSGPVIEWDAVEGRSYEILWSGDLVFDPFSPIMTNAYPVNIYTDTLHAADSDGYYKMKVWIAE